MCWRAALSLFVASRGPAHRAMSYELFSRMAGAAPLAARSLRGSVLLGLSGGLRCCLAPGDSGHFIAFSGLPVEGGVAATDRRSFDRNPIWHWSLMSPSHSGRFTKS